MRLPNSNHPITIEPFRGRVRVMLNDALLADTRKALVLQEADYLPTYYIPRDDAKMDLLERTARSTHCPYKGDASYYSVRGNSQAQNAVWSYEEPYPAVAEIGSYLAFYPNKVKIEAK